MKTFDKQDVSQIPCVHWDECGGCPLIQFPYKEQLAKKHDKVRKAFLDHEFTAAELQKVLKPTKPSPRTLGYRNKAKWILQESAEGLSMGIYAPGTHDVVDIPHCAVHAQPINAISLLIKEELQRLGVRCGPVLDAEPRVRYVIVRYSFRDKKFIVVFITSAPKVPLLEKVVEAIDREFSGQVAAVVQNINDDEGNVLLGEANRYLRRGTELTENLGRFRVPVGPLSFVQVNTGQAAHLYNRVRELIGNGPFEAGLDLYSGVGLFALHLSAVTKRILAVEEVGPAALEAMTAARRNRAKNLFQVCGDALEGVQTFHGEWGIPDWVVLNPPRKGCEEAVLHALCQRPPRKIAYVSCNPRTLARDVAILRQQCPDLILKSLEPVDMFPQTEHVECIALLENRSFSKSSPKGPKPSMRGRKPLH
jgi:23S rRNA (uracil1939-C5)-methyltransferase